MRSQRLGIEELTRYTGWSVFWYFGVMLIWSITAYFFTNHFKLDFTYILLFWMALSIKDGSTTACKWGIFCMLVYGAAAAVVCFSLLLSPARVEFEKQINPEYRRFYFAGIFIYVLWSIANVKYLIQILRVRQVRFWTKPVIAGYAVVALLIAGLCMPSLLNLIRGYRSNILKMKYADAIEYLKMAARGEVPTSMNWPELTAIREAHPEIVEASIYREPRGSQRVIYREDFSVPVSWGNRPLPSLFNSVTYSEYTKDQYGKWVKIELRVETGADPNTVDSQQSSVISQQSTVNSQQSTVNSHQSSVNSDQ